MMDPILSLEGRGLGLEASHLDEGERAAGDDFEAESSCSRIDPGHCFGGTKSGAVEYAPDFSSATSPGASLQGLPRLERKLPSVDFSGPNYTNRFLTAGTDRPPTPPQPPPHVSALYQDHANLPPADVVTEGGRTYGRIHIIGDKEIQSAWEVVRSHAAKIGPAGRKLLAMERSDGHPVWFYPYRRADPKPFVIRGHVVEKSPRTRLSSRTRKHANEPPFAFVTFGVDEGALTKTGGRLTATTMALHEWKHLMMMDHPDYEAWGDVPMGRFSERGEYHIMTGIERDSQIAQYQRPRDEYTGSFFYTTDGFSSTKAVNGEVEQVLKQYTPYLDDATRLIQDFNVDLANPPPKPSRLVTNINNVGTPGEALLYRDWLMAEVTALARSRQGQAP